ncbi:MAG: hypothetical protein HFG75_10290 [Hungatella sp.]|nr:hypothetical protein [Hungatella sp.]MCI8892993.1 hypothetical protein [Eubacterium sp.]
MNIKEKIDDLLKYCSSYQGHTYMMDERREDQTFQVLLPEEQDIMEHMDKLQFVLLTGEAGDGKSRLLRSLNQQLLRHEFEIYTDFSAMLETEKQKVLQVISNIVSGETEKHIIIAANIGIFTKSVLRYQPGLLEKLDIDNEKVRIINFEKRNLASDKEVFAQIIKGFLEYDGFECQECSICGQCVFRNNLEYIRTENGIESIRILCDAVYLIGEHITFRELLSMVAYMITFGENCYDRKNIPSSLLSSRSYENIFNFDNDRILQHIKRMDPAHAKFGLDMYDSIETCISQKRSDFFKETGDKYALLNIDYLPEFREAIRFFQEKAYTDSSTIQQGVLYSLKRGLGRLTRKGQSDLGMTVVDTPAMLGDKIQTEFELGNMDIVWNRYGLDFNNLNEKKIKEESRNRFCMSYIYNDSKGQIKSITMVIDYRLFRYLMMANDYYYLGHSNQSVEEYTINTFFRKILKTRKDIYGKMLVKFTEKNEKGVCNFSLSLQKKNSILFPGEKIVKLKREG